MPGNSTGYGPYATRHGPGNALRRNRYPRMNFKEVAWLVVLDPMLILLGMEHLSGARRYLPLPWHIGEQHETRRFLVFTPAQRSLGTQGRPQPRGQRFARAGLVPTRPPR